MGKVKRTLSILLAVAMVVTCIPQAGLTAKAAELDAADVVENAAVEDISLTNEDSNVIEDIDVDEGEENKEEEVVSDEETVKDSADGEIAMSPMDDTEEPGDPTTYDVTIATGLENCEIILPTENEGKATENAAYTFKVKPNTGYKITKVSYTISDKTEDITPTEEQAAAESEYTIPENTITADVEVSATAEAVTTEEPEPTVETVDLTIDNYLAVKRQMTIEVKVGTDAAAEVKGATTAVAKDADVTLLLTPNKGVKIKTVLDGETDLKDKVTVADGTYSYAIGKLTGAKTIKITTAKAYDLDFDNDNAEGTSIKLDETLKDLASVLELDGTTNTNSVVEKDATKDVVFTVAGFDATAEANADKKLHVYYVVDGSDVDAKELEADDKGNYTVPKKVISIVEESVKIVLEVEEKSAVTITSNDKVDVKVWGKDSDGKEAWVASTGNDKGFIGDEFKFQAKGVAPYAVSKVKVNGKEIEVAENGEYSIVLEGATMIAFETEIDAKESNQLTFTIEGAKNSATAEITSVTPAAADSDTTPTPITGDAEKIAEALGMTLPDGATGVELKAGEPVKVPKTVTAFTVTVAATNGYALSKAEGEDNAKTAYMFATEESTGVEAIDKEMKVNVKTEIVPLAADAYFKAKIKDNDQGLESLTVKTEDGKVEQAKDTEGNDVKDVYKVIKDATTVEVTVKAKEGYSLEDLTANTLVQSVEEKTADDGSTEYTVLIFANAIKGADTDNATSFEVESVDRTFTAKVDPALSDEFEVKDFTYTTVTVDEDGEETETSPTPITDSTKIPYGASLKATITAKTGCDLTSVTYTMGGDPVTVDVAENAASVSIDKVTADVEIKVESSKAYSLTGLTTASGTPVKAEYGVYPVSYSEAYLVGVTQGGAPVPAKDITAVVKDANDNEVPMSTPVVNNNYRKINLATQEALRGQEITVEMYVAGVEEKVGTYVLSVNKETTYIRILGADGKETNKIEQRVDSFVVYTIDTDGTLDDSSNVVTENTAGLISWAEIYDGRLEIAMAAKSAADITGKTATITIKADDNDDVTATVTVTAKELFNETKAPTVTKTANAAADTVFHVDVKMDLGAGFEEPYYGSLWYEVKAEAKPKDGETLPAELKQTVTEYVERTGNEQRVKLVAGNNELLGTGAAWDYEVTAQLIYRSAWDEDYDYAGTIVTKSDVSEKAECGTIDPLFTTALKLKGVKDKVALYTGRLTESVIATIQWNSKDKDEKFYKVANENIQDDKYGLHFEVRGDQIVVTSIDADAVLGKHTITVLATADQTPGHEMYASRATIAVTVVKGINQIDVTTPSTSIYKPEGTKKAATLKLGVVYNDDSWNYDGKKWVNTPKAKKVTWEIIGANSFEDEFCAAPKNITDFVKVKNGTVTVDKKFQVDQNNPYNNQFMVKVTANDYAGNETYGLSDVIEITNDAVDISKLILVNWNSEISKYEVKAVHDIKDKQAVEIAASVANGGHVYALPEKATVAVNDTFASLDDLESELPVVDTDKIAFASGNKKVLTVSSTGSISVLAAGKKAAVKVTTADGNNNKKTHTMNLTLDYKATAGSDLALGIWVSTADANYSGTTKEVFLPTTAENVTAANEANVKDKEVKANFTTTGAARLSVRLYVGSKAEADTATTSYGIPTDVRYTNYKLAVKGGKFVTNADGTATIITTAKETTLTLTDLSKEAKAAGKKAYVYKLTNNAYDAEKVAKAPKVTVKNTLHEWGTTDEQQVGLTVLDANKKPYAAGKSVKVEMDWSARTDKNVSNLNTFAAAIESNIIDLKEDSTTLKIADKGEEEDWAKDLTPGSYKLKVTVGTKAADGTFTAETLPATVTVKVIKAKVATFKLNATYTIGELDGAVTLTGKSNLNAKAGEKMETRFLELKNANVNGKVNNFTKYFAIDQDKTSGTWRLVMTKALKDALAANRADVEKEFGSKGLTGYISYWAWPNVNYYNQSKLNATDVKITVKLAKSGKTGSTYKADNAAVGTTTDKGKNQTQIDIVVNGEKVNVGYAAIDAAKDSAEFEIDTAVSATGAKDGQVVLKVKKDVEIKDKKSYTVNLKVVPADSYYASAIDAAPNAAQTPSTQADGDTTTATKEALIQQYGIAVKVSVKASESYENPKADDTEEPENPTPGPDDPTPGPSEDEKTLEGVAGELEAVPVTAWMTEENGEQVQIKVTYKADDDSITDESNIVDSLVTAVSAWITGQEGDAYKDFTVAKKDTSFTLDKENGKATITMTLTKGTGDDATTKDVTITVAAEADTTVVTPPEGGDE